MAAAGSGAPLAYLQWTEKGYIMNTGLVLLIILILLLIGAFPSWPYSQGWGYAPTGVLATILLVVIILMLLGRL